MSELCAYDLDGTIRPGCLLTEALKHGAEAGFIDLSQFKDPDNPTYDEVDYFVSAITRRSRREFIELTDRLSDEAKDQAYPWALERLSAHHEDKHVIIVSHAPDFLVRAFARGLGTIRRGRGSWFHTTDHVFSGRAVTLDKRQATNRYMREHGLAHFAFAAGDTLNDLPILERATEATVVNPDKTLAAMASEQGWEIITTP